MNNNLTTKLYFFVLGPLAIITILSLATFLAWLLNG